MKAVRSLPTNSYRLMHGEQIIAFMNFGGAVSPVEQERIAKQAAAAPALLMACREAAQQFGHMEDPADVEVLDIVDAAIALATE